MPSLVALKDKARIHKQKLPKKITQNYQIVVQLKDFLEFYLFDNRKSSFDAMEVFQHLEKDGHHLGVLKMKC